MVLAQLFQQHERQGLIAAGRAEEDAKNMWGQMPARDLVVPTCG